jgi:hypothetical protein
MRGGVDDGDDGDDDDDTDLCRAAFVQAYLLQRSVEWRRPSEHYAVGAR